MKVMYKLCVKMYVITEWLYQHKIIAYKTLEHINNKCIDILDLFIMKGE